MNIPHKPTTKTQAGFTIVELMIATVVFSTVLVVITAGVLYFTRTYYASINRSNTQNAARAIIANISQAVQFTGTTIATSDDTGGSYFCAGGNIYTFVPGVRYMGGTATAANPGLYVVPQSSGCAALPATVGAYNNAAGQQLLGSGMRIANLTLKNIGGQLYTISLTLLYGTDDLLTATTGSSANCKLQTGAQFCATSALTTSVERRLQDGQLSN